MGSRSYPIWNEVTSCIYNSSKSFGAKNTSSMTVKVGSSGSNSHEHAEICTTRRVYQHPKYGEVIRFATSVDDVIIKESLFEHLGNEKAGKMIKQNSKLTRIKSL